MSRCSKLTFKRFYYFLTLSIGLKNLLKLPIHYLIGCKKNFTFYLCHASPIFDKTWYKTEYLKDCSIDPTIHFATIGRKQGNKPNQFFEPAIYAKCNQLKDPAFSFIHFCIFGKYFGKYQDFNADDYAYLYGCDEESHLTAFESYIHHAMDRFGKVVLKERSESLNKNPTLSTNTKDQNTKAQNKKVLLINNEYSVTGAPLFLSAMAKVLVELGYDVDVWTLPIRLTHQDLFENVNCNVRVVPNKVDDIKLQQALKSYDVVFCNTIVCHKFAQHCLEHDIKHYWLIHEPVFQLQDYCKDNACHDLLVNEGQKANVLCVSEYSQEQMLQEYGFKAKILRNFIDDEQVPESILTTEDPSAYNTSNNKPLVSEVEDPNIITFGFVGTLLKVKGIDLLIQAFLNLPSSVLNKCRLVICGARFELFKEEFKELYQESLKCPQIIYKGLLQGEEKEQTFKQIDVFVISSLEETCSRVALEAAAMKKPVILTEKVGAKYILKYGGGEIVKTNNVDALEKALIKYSAMSKDELSSLGKLANQGFVETSSKQAFIEALQNLD